jgi:hypothetical protein
MIDGSTHDLTPARTEPTMRLLTALYQLLARLLAKLRASDRYNVGHGAGCECEPCRNERQSREAW